MTCLWTWRALESESHKLGNVFRQTLYYSRTELGKSSVVEVFNFVVIVVVIGEGLRGEGGGLLPVPPRLAHLLDEDVDDGLQSVSRGCSFSTLLSHTSSCSNDIG